MVKAFRDIWCGGQSPRTGNRLGHAPITDQTKPEQPSAKDSQRHRLRGRCRRRHDRKPEIIQSDDVPGVLVSGPRKRHLSDLGRTVEEAHEVLVVITSELLLEVV